MSDRDRHLGRVHALLAKVKDGSGCTEEERRTSAVAACALILKHDLLAQPPPVEARPGARDHGNACARHGWPNVHVACMHCAIENEVRRATGARASARSSTIYGCTTHSYSGNTPCPQCVADRAAGPSPRRSDGSRAHDAHQTHGDRGCMLHPRYVHGCRYCHIVRHGVAPNDAPPAGPATQRQGERCTCARPATQLPEDRRQVFCSRCGGEPLDPMGRTRTERAQAEEEHARRQQADVRYPKDHTYSQGAYAYPSAEDMQSLFNEFFNFNRKRSDR
jgi:hypothetical protein